MFTAWDDINTNESLAGFVDLLTQDFRLNPPEDIISLPSSDSASDTPENTCCNSFQFANCSSNSFSNRNRSNNGFSNSQLCNLLLPIMPGCRKKSHKYNVASRNSPFRKLFTNRLDFHFVPHLFFKNPYVFWYYVQTTNFKACGLQDLGNHVGALSRFLVECCLFVLVLA